MKTIYCDEVKEKFGLQNVECCISCHEDSSLGYYLIGIEFKDGTYAEVCCTVSIALGELENNK